MTMSPETTRALEMIDRGVREAFEGRLVRLVLFGGQARGDARESSAVDVAVVLDTIDDKAAERLRLSDIAYEVIIATSVEVQAWPISEHEWTNPETHRNPTLVHAMKRDGLVLWSRDASLSCEDEFASFLIASPLDESDFDKGTGMSLPDCL